MELSAEHITVSLNRKRIIEDISLRVEENSFCALLGPNGSGKSTFLKTVYRCLSPDSGCVYLDNENMSRKSGKEIAQKMAVVGQFNNINFDYSVFDIVLMGRTPHKSLLEREGKRDLKIAAEALEKVGLADYKDRSYQSLSGGEKQRVILARALTQKPQILILDEPTNHLDIRYQLETLSIIKNLGITVLTALHDLNLAVQFCDYVYMMKGGRIRAQGRVPDMMRKDIIRDIYEVDADVFKSPIDGRLMIEYHA